MVRLTNLAAVRKRRYMSLSDLAQAAGLSRTTIFRIEQGLVEPHPRTVRKLADALGVTPDELVGEQDEGKAIAA